MDNIAARPSKFCRSLTVITNRWAAWNGRRRRPTARSGRGPPPPRVPARGSSRRRARYAEAVERALRRDDVVQAVMIDIHNDRVLSIEHGGGGSGLNGRPPPIGRSVHSVTPRRITDILREPEPGGALRPHFSSGCRFANHPRLRWQQYRNIGTQGSACGLAARGRVASQSERLGFS